MLDFCNTRFLVHFASSTFSIGADESFQQYLSMLKELYYCIRVVNGGKPLGEGNKPYT
jgi:hypothetical protein